MHSAQSMKQYLVLDEECETDSEEHELKFLFDAVDDNDDSSSSSSSSSKSSDSSSDKKAGAMFCKIQKLVPTYLYCMCC